MHTSLKTPTYVAQITQHLAAADDFVKLDSLVDRFAGKITVTNVYRTLRHLKDHHAADFIFEAGCTYWYLTLDTDDRLRHVEERSPEDRERKSAAKVRSTRHTGSSGYSVVHGARGEQPK